MKAPVNPVCQLIKKIGIFGVTKRVSMNKGPNMKSDFWKDYSVTDEKEPLCLSLGPLRVWVQRKGEEIWISHRYEQDQNPGKGEESRTRLPEDAQWSRWAHKSSAEPLSVTPVFSNLPVVVSSEFPLKIAPGSRIQIFTRIPVWMRISFSKSNYILTEIPSVKLSRTWFGSPLEGELCYWLTTKARRSLSEVENKPYVVNCPIWIINKADEDLNFEKFCYRVERLGIHLLNHELWAGETQIIYQGQELNSDITMTGKLPLDSGKGEELSKPRSPVTKSLATRTFKKFFDNTFISAR